jgi:CelD/BcsL family acetyltransferase involved in cellulose biosynthesis
MLQIEEIRTLAEFEKLRDEWRELQGAARAESIFLSHTWLSVCARCLSVGQQLLILLLRREGKLVGAAPLVQENVRVRHLPATQIHFLSNALTPFVDFLLIDPEEGLQAILKHFREVRTNWELLSLSKIREDSPHREWLERMLARRDAIYRKTTTGWTPYLRIEGSWDSFYQSKSAKFKKTRRSVTNKVERLGPVKVELLTRPEEAAAGLEVMFAVSERSWKRNQGTDLLAPHFEREFFSHLTRVASSEGWLRLWLLKLEDRPLASEYHLDDHGTEYALRAQYDEEYSSCSPGNYLDTYIVRYLFENGCRRYDMGPGAVDYKLAWTESGYHCHVVELYNSRLYPQIVGRMETSWIPAIKASAFGRWIARRQRSRS